MLLDEVHLKYLQRCLGIEFVIWSHTLITSIHAPAFLFRVRELMFANIMAEKFLPFTFSSGTAWTELVRVLTSGNTPFPAVSTRRVKHRFVEM